MLIAFVVLAIWVLARNFEHPLCSPRPSRLATQITEARGGPCAFHETESVARQSHDQKAAFDSMNCIGTQNDVIPIPGSGRGICISLPAANTLAPRRQERSGHLRIDLFFHTEPVTIGIWIGQIGNWSGLAHIGNWTGHRKTFDGATETERLLQSGSGQNRGKSGIGPSGCLRSAIVTL